MTVEPTIARCGICGTQYTARAWPWLESVGAIRDERRQCAVPGCCAPVARASVTALRPTTESHAANDRAPVIEGPKRSESPMKPKKSPAKKTAAKAVEVDETPAIISIRGHTPADYAAFERARARLSARVGGAFVSLSQAVLVLARLQAAREDAEERARVEAEARPARDALVLRFLAARAAVEQTTVDGWQGTAADRAALVAAEEQALAALARDAGAPT